MVEELKKELDEKGIAYKKDIQVGIMVETAAASLIADLFAKEADFFSIGTNDLTQYTMSVDRGNKKVSYLYSTFNPAVLQQYSPYHRLRRESGHYGRNVRRGSQRSHDDSAASGLRIK